MRKQYGFSLIELLIVVSIILIIAAITVPNLLRSRIAANEASAVGSLRILNTSESIYNTTYGFFTCTLTDLGPPTGGTLPSSTAAALIDNKLATGNKSGFSFTAGSCTSSNGFITTYQWLADPAAPGTSGSRHFCTDETLQIRVDPNSAANCLSIGSPVG